MNLDQLFAVLIENEIGICKQVMVASAMLIYHGPKLFQHYCIQHGGHLVHINNAYEDAFLVNFIRHMTRKLVVVTFE